MIRNGRRRIHITKVINPVRGNPFWPSEHSILSPSGKVSKRAEKAAKERLRVELFGEEGLQRTLPTQPSKKEILLRQAKELRELAARGMHPRKYVKHAEKLEEEASLL